MLRTIPKLILPHYSQINYKVVVVYLSYRKNTSNNIRDFLNNSKLDSKYLKNTMAIHIL